MITRDEIYTQLSLSDFADIVEATKIVEGKLRILLIDGSHIDVWLSLKKKGVYAYHWERRAIDGSVYRHNNLPDKTARKLKTFPKHFHNGTEKTVVESHISDEPVAAVKSLLEFARNLVRR
jgi:hypothetical protein